MLTWKYFPEKKVDEIFDCANTCGRGGGDAVGSNGYTRHKIGATEKQNGELDIRIQDKQNKHQAALTKRKHRKGNRLFKKRPKVNMQAVQHRNSNTNVYVLPTSKNRLLKQNHAKPSKADKKKRGKQERILE